MVDRRHESGGTTSGWLPDDHATSTRGMKVKASVQYSDYSTAFDAVG